jgi:nucleotide-binding universal stress UspA family protein
MAAYGKICCAVDFSESSRTALLEAADLARREGAHLTVLHVQEDPTGAAGQGVSGPPAGNGGKLPALEALRGEAEWIRDDVVGTVIVSGPVAASIAQFARETGADLLVLGSHGRTGLQRRALGSVAEAVLRLAPCPVLVVRSPKDERREAGSTLMVALP